MFRRPISTGGRVPGKTVAAKVADIMKEMWKHTRFGWATTRERNRAAEAELTEYCRDNARYQRLLRACKTANAAFERMPPYYQAEVLERFDSAVQWYPNRARMGNSARLLHRDFQQNYWG